jgi:hypothetical protein
MKLFVWEAFWCSLLRSPLVFKSKDATDLNLIGFDKVNAWAKRWANVSTLKGNQGNLSDVVDYVELRLQSPLLLE